MASRMYDAISKTGEHGIGDLNTKWAKHLVNGAITYENIDNYTLAELSGYDSDNNLTCKQLSDVKNEGFLVTTIEEEQLLQIGDYQETYPDFYNGKDEIVRLTRLEKGVRFDTSSFSLNTGVTAVTVGMVAHFDPTTKKYIISVAATPHADYANAANKFEVVNPDSDFGYEYDVKTIKLQCK